MSAIDTTLREAEDRLGPGEAACLSAARKALFHWAEVISSGDVASVLALYAPDAILVPTLSNEIGEREEERRRYFESFLSNQGLRCTISSQKKRVSRKLGTVVIGGLYTFDFIRNGRAESVPARFLFTFEEIDGRWLITGHHSSRLSEAI
ncbi:nuclear transport factor 2 family protein [Ancylobacter mangrovi]|uniref:nuclear transport factor 2 family protein n=1 Tax=Ancylobacter mangrovi TaxID=2972472 RepID=UPI00216264A0|nr:nuclear transport factor 2 family protein [Ancylobacter mangrovi]MCS0504748.1 nuclear transport factor 2 family protein [Ancylobacter mangrovi]